MPKYKIKKLKNGITLITIPFKNFNSTYIRAYFRAGSRHETKINSGISHLTEHLIFKKINQFASFEKSKLVDNPITQNFTATTFKDLVVYAFEIHCKDTHKTLKLLSHTLTDNNFKNKDIKTEKEIILEEISNDKDKFLFEFDKKFRNEYYKNNPLKFSTAGVEKNIKNFNLNNIKQHFNLYYQPQNMILVVSGKIDSNKIQKFIENNFKFNSKGKKNKITLYKKSPNKIFIINKKTTQLFFNLTHSFFNITNQDRIKWEVFRFALRNYLYNTIRNQGFCYSFDVNIDEFEEFFNLNITADVSAKKILKFYKELEEKIKDFKNEFKQDDLRLVKEAVIKDYEISKTYPLACAKNLGWQAAIFGTEKIISYEEMIKIVKNISLKDIQKIYNIFLKNKGSLFVIGNQTEKNKKEIKQVFNKQ